MTLSQKLDVLIELMARMVELMETPEQEQEAPDPYASLDD